MSGVRWAHLLQSLTHVSRCTIPKWRNLGSTAPPTRQVFASDGLPSRDFCFVFVDSVNHFIEPLLQRGSFQQSKRSRLREVAMIGDAGCNSFCELEGTCGHLLRMITLEAYVTVCSCRNAAARWTLVACDVTAWSTWLMSVGITTAGGSVWV